MNHTKTEPEDSKIVDRLDHLVLTVTDLDKTIEFYTTLGMEAVRFVQKINLHEAGREFEPKALKPAPRSADICFITNNPLERFMNLLRAKGIGVIEGPGGKNGRHGLNSVRLCMGS